MYPAGMKGTARGCVQALPSPSQRPLTCEFHIGYQCHRGECNPAAAVARCFHAVPLIPGPESASILFT
uniref:Uncharacterized protein n=1 Tax=Anguilla anguilla TaxID=7936 RepID=A0A0E9SIT5_ANGAN